jgi:hypothetical protein
LRLTKYFLLWPHHIGNAFPAFVIPSAQLALMFLAKHLRTVTLRDVASARFLVVAASNFPAKTHRQPDEGMSFALC